MRHASCPGIRTRCFASYAKKMDMLRPRGQSGFRKQARRSMDIARADGESATVVEFRRIIPRGPRNVLNASLRGVDLAGMVPSLGLDAGPKRKTGPGRTLV